MTSKRRFYLTFNINILFTVTILIYFLSTLYRCEGPICERVLIFLISQDSYCPCSRRNVFFRKKSQLYMRVYFPCASRRAREREGGDVTLHTALQAGGWSRLELEEQYSLSLVDHQRPSVKLIKKIAHKKCLRFHAEKAIQQKVCQIAFKAAFLLSVFFIDEVFCVEKIIAALSFDPILFVFLVQLSCC